MARGVIQFSITDAAGNVIPEASVTVRNSDTLSLVPLHSARTGGSTLGNPVNADENGFFRAYCDEQRVNITAMLGEFTRTWVDVPVLGDVIGAISGSWAPTVTFATPGDFSSSDGGRYARWARVGNMVSFTLNITFTPTFTTASGAFLIPLPPALTAHAPLINTAVGSLMFLSNAPDYAGGRDQAVVSINASGEFLTVTTFASGIAGEILTSDGFNGGGATQYALRMSGGWTL